MFQVKYSILSGLKNINPSELDEMSFRYDFCLGKALLISDKSTIDLQWEWIPLLDFAFSLVLINRKMNSKDFSKEIFDFTETDGTLNFSRERNLVLIKTSYSEESLECLLTNFTDGVTLFYKQLLNDIKKENPEVLKNPSFQKFDTEPFSLVE